MLLRPKNKSNAHESGLTYQRRGTLDVGKVGDVEGDDEEESEGRGRLLRPAARAQDGRRPHLLLGLKLPHLVFKDDLGC